MASEWEDAPSANDGWEDAPDEKLNKQVSKIGDTLLGGLETAGMIGSGAVAQVAGLVPAGLQALNNLGQGEAPNFEKNYASAIDRMTYSPRTEMGQDMGDAVGDFMNRNVVPIAPMYLGGMGGAMSRAGAARRAPKDVAQSNADALIQKRERQPSRADRPNVDVDVSQGPNLPPVMNVTREGQAFDPAAQPFREAAEQRVVQERMNQMPDQLAKMQDAEILARLKEIDRQETMMEPVNSDALMSKVVKDQDQALIERLKQINREQPDAPMQGRETLFVDPSNQVFRGDPAEPLAARGLDMQKEAARNNLEHGLATSKGQPMDLLSMDSLRSANEGPQARPQDIINNGLRQALIQADAENHPLVTRALDRVTKQEELIVKINELLNEGRSTRSQLARAERDLAKLEESAYKTIKNVLEAKSQGKRARPFNFKKQGGAINPEVFKEGFSKIIGGKNGVKYEVSSRPNENPQLNSIQVIAKDVHGQKVGEYSFGPKGENLYAWGAETIPNMRRQGIASGAYDAVRSLGNDIVPSTRQTADGKAFWNNKQRGAINPEVFKAGFQKLKQLPEGVWLRAHSDGQSLTVEAVKDSHKLAGAVFEKTNKYDSPSDVNMAATMVGSKYPGMATEIYKFASELGNDIVPSKIRTQEGSAMWERFNQRGIAENNVIRSPGNKQRGAIDPDVFLSMFPSFAKSKMRGHDGKLQKFYHGTSKDKHFDDIKSTRHGAWFTDDAWTASQYAFENDSRGYKWEAGRPVEKNTAARVHEVYLNLENPYKFTEADHKALQAKGENYKKNQSDFFDELKAKGYDGVDYGGSAVAFYPEQIKSAISPQNKTALPKGPGKKQTGAIFTDPKRAEKLSSVGAAEKILGPIRPSQWTPEQAIEMAKDAPDMEQNIFQKASNYLTKGGLYMADRTKNPLVRYGVEQLLEADRLARADIQEFIHHPRTGMGAVFRELNAKEQRDVWKILDRADFDQQAFSREELVNAGFSPKQINAIEVHRAVMDRAFESMNKVREAMGEPPVDKRTAYAAMNASGDYRMLVKKDGEIVGMIGRNDKYSANELARRLKDQGYEIGEQHYVGGIPRERGNAQQAMLQALDFLAKNDPRLQELLLKADEVMKSEGYNFLNMPVHTKEKKGIFGMQGRKNDLLIDIKKQQRLEDLNAKEGLQAQMGYAEMALKWERMAEATTKISEVVNSEGLKGKQPLAKQWVNDYLQNALGYNPEKMGRALENFFSEAANVTGIGWSNGRKAIATARKVTNTVLLGLNHLFWTANVVQPLVSLPGMKASLVAKGLDPAFDFGTGYLYLAKGGMTDLKRQMGAKLSKFEQEAFDYAKSHHVYGSDLIEHSNRVRKDTLYRLEQAGNFVAGGIESGTRRGMFLTFAHMLKDNGMKVSDGLFEAAHNLTDMAMNNYSAIERPRMYNAMGPIGDLAANLVSFKHNELSRYAMFARQLAEDKSARPLLAQLAANVAFAGIMGTVLFEEADQLYKYITTKMGKPDSLSLRVMELSGAASKAVGIDNKHLLSHGVFSGIGLDMTKRLGLSDVVPDTLGEAMFPGGSKLAEIASTGMDALKHQDEWHTKKFVREITPGAFTGAEDLTWFSKGDMAINRNTTESQYRRDTADKIIKATGGTSVKESTYKQKHYENQWIKKAYADLRKGPLERAHGEMITKGRVLPETIQEYLKYEGDLNTLQADIARTLRKQGITAKDRDMLRSSMSKSITSLRHAQRLQESFQE